MNLSGNDLFDILAITKVEEGNITEKTDNILRARSINARTTSLTIAYRF